MLVEFNLFSIEFSIDYSFGERGSTLAPAVVVLVAVVIIGGLSFHDMDGDALRNYQEWIGPTEWRNSDTDRDGGLDGKEVNLFGTDPTVPQDVYKVNEFLREGGFSYAEVNYMNSILEDSEFKTLAFDVNLHEDGSITNSEMEYLEILGGSPEDVRNQIFEASLHEDGKITWKEVSLVEDEDKDGRINYLEKKFPVFSYALDKGLPENVAENLKPLDQDETMSDLEKKYVDLLLRTKPSTASDWRDPHNTTPQIISAGFQKDEKITENEFSSSKDPDEDGLINYMEEKIGTNPDNKDTDQDQLLDGWEVYGVKRRGYEPVPLDEYGANPLKNDIFVEIIGESLPKDVKDKITQVFANAPVDNGKGINLHIDDDTPGYSLGGQNVSFEKIEEYGDNMGCLWRINDHHPRYGVFHYCVVTTGLCGELRGYNFSISSWTGAETFVHELGHNILGQLDEKNRGNFDRYEAVHSKYEEYAMWPANPIKATYHPNVWQEIDRDGPLGLPYLSNWKVSYQ